MEVAEDLFPVSQKLCSVHNAVEETESDLVVDKTVLADKDFEYLSQVCESTNPSFDEADLFQDEHVDVTQSAVIPLVPYDDEVSSGEDSSDFSLGFFGDLMQSGAPSSLVFGVKSSPPAPGPMSDAEWLQSQGIDFKPEEW